MKKELAFIAAAALLISAGCGRINDHAAETEKSTTAAETETTAVEDTTVSADKFGTEFFMLPDIRLGMTEEEVKPLIDGDFERSEKKSNDIGPNVVYYNIPFDSFPYLGIDMEGYERLAFVPDGELISMTCHFGVTDRDHTVKNKHSEEEIKAVYDKLFEQIYAHYGDYYNTNDKFDNFIGDAGWSNSFGTLSVTAVYLPDKETGDVYMQDISDEAYSKLLAGAKETAQVTTTDSSDKALLDGELISEESLFSQLDSRFTIDQALSFIGKEPAYSEERISCPFYEWNFDKDDAFGTELPFTLYVEFDKSKDRISSYGYELGVHRIDGRYESLCDKDEIKKIFKALTPRFEAEYGTRSNEDIGSDSIYMWDDPNLTLLLLSDSESTDIIGSNFICIARSYE